MLNYIRTIMKEPLVSIIVTTKNEEDVLEMLLVSIAKQTYKDIETIVVDNYSSDRTVSIARKHASRVYSKGPERSAQRNYGAKKSRGTYMLFLDADMQLSPNVIAESVAVFTSMPDTAAIVVPEESIGYTFWERIKAFERSFYCLERGEDFEAARFFRRDIFVGVCGYDEHIVGPEDWDLPKTIKKEGYAIRRIDSKIYHHERINSLLLLGRKKYYYGLQSHRYLSKQKISLVSPDTIYFLRPVFYKHWKKLLQQPILASGMVIMFLVELGAGGLGYFVGRLRDARFRTS